MSGNSTKDNERKNSVTVEKREDDSRDKIGSLRKNNIIGSISALLAALTITLASAAVQGLEQRWPDMELNIFRWGFMIISLIVYFIWKKTPPSIPREKIPYVLFYGILVSSEQVIFFTAVNFLPLGLMAALFRISLVTMAAIASRIIEKERFTIFRAAAVVLGITGILFMTQPKFIFGGKEKVADTWIDNKTVIITNVTNFDISNISNDTTPKESDEKDSNSLLPSANLSSEVRLYIGIALTVFAAFLGILQGVCMKRRRLVDYCVWKISFWIGVMGLVWTTCLSFALEKAVFIVSAYDLGLVACYAIMASAHSFTFLYALKKTSYLIVAIIMVTQIVFNLLAQYTFMKHVFPGKHNAIEIVGGVLVMFAAALPTISEILNANPNCCNLSRKGKKHNLSKIDKGDSKDTDEAENMI